MKRILYIIGLSILLCVNLCGCDILPQTFDYSPNKAYAKIAQRVSVSKGFYAEYTNHHYYIVDDGTITVMDKPDKSAAKKQIEYDWRKFYPDCDDWTYLIDGGNGIMELNGRITFMMTLTQQFNDSDKGLHYHYPIFSVNADGSDFGLSDITADIVSAGRLDNFYFDNDNALLYTAIYRSYDSKVLHRYRYDESSDHFVKEDYNAVLDDYDLTEFYLTNKRMAAVLYFYDSFEKWTLNRLTVFKGYESDKYQQVDMTHLSLRQKPLAVFCDEKDIWLYINSGYYEFIKIQCIGDVYSLKE